MQTATAAPTTNATTRGAWQLSDGGWSKIEQTSVARAARPIDDPELMAIQKSMVKSDYEASRKSLITWLRANPTSAFRDQALMMMARTLYAGDDLIRAFFYCDELMDTYADSVLYSQAMQLQYDIADEYLKGRKDKFWGMRLLGRKEDAVEMLFRVQQRNPGSPVAEKSLLRTADHYWDEGDFDLAADAYDSFGNSFPRSPLARDVQLQEARSNLAQYNGPKFDATPIINAREQLVQLAGEDPLFARQNEVEPLISESERQLARKLVISADFYRRTGKPAARKHLLARLVRDYPGTPEAQSARVELGIENQPTNPAP